MIIGLITFLTNCDISNKENFENSRTQDNYQIQKIVKEQIPELLNNSCSKIDYEVINIYPNIEEPG